jgi:hypothetical protein
MRSLDLRAAMSLRPSQLRNRLSAMGEALSFSRKPGNTFRKMQEYVETIQVVSDSLSQWQIVSNVVSK